MAKPFILPIYCCPPNLYTGKLVKNLSDIPNKNLIVNLLMLNLMDMIITIVAINYFGAIEANPLMRYFTDRGLVYFAIIKMMVPTIMVSLYAKYWVEKGVVLVRRNLLLFLCGIYVFVNMWNILLLLFEISGAMLLSA